MEFELKNNQQIEKIEIAGNPQEIFGIKSAHSFQGFMNSKIKHFLKFPEAKYTGKEIELMLRSTLAVYEKFHLELSSLQEIKSWKSESSFDFIKTPEYFKVITWQKPDQDNDAKAINHIIYKSELNNIIKSIDLLSDKELIKTRDIARHYCFFSNITHNNQNKPLFEGDFFNFSTFFSDRSLHLKLNICLRLLDKLGFIKYRGGKIKVINKLDIQTMFI